ncbi:MAG TPA: FGGY-family carbohydrate kinase [Terriglobales bacterium]|nr:FGGY-family carbohydrate kinase [Terriglobales bacterium]
MSLLAIDMGSSSCKAVVFSEEGRVLVWKSCSYPAPDAPYPSWAQMPAEHFWQALVTVCQATASEARADPVDVLAISSHGETLVPVNSQQQAVAPAILNFDNRAVAEANGLAETLGSRRVFDITGLAVHPMYPVAKMVWLRQHQPDVFSSVARFLAVPCYLLTRLGLEALVDYSLASRFLAFDIRTHTWSPEILSACQLNTEQLPQSVPAGTVAGQLSSGVAAQLGLKGGAVVVVGGHDQPCSALGCGVLDPGRISASLGTYECLVAASRAPVLNDRAFTANLNSYCHVVPDRYVTLAYFPSGIMLDWFLRLLYSKGELAPSSVSELCGRLEADAPRGPTGLCIMPHLLGTCNPDFNPNATGVIAGILPSTRRADLYKGIIEGIACEFANMAVLMQEAIGPYADVYLSGGGSRSLLGLRLRAAMAGRQLHLMRCPEAVCLGTAILAGTAAGTYRDFAEAVGQVVRVSETIVPDAAIAESYEPQILQYRVLYPSLAPLWRARSTPK